MNHHPLIIIRCRTR